ncbi:MAG TPA: hypothetical protein VF776_01330 [Sphingomicrobium sp.]
MLEVNQTADGDPLCFEVVVMAGRSRSRHEVTMSRADYQRLSDGRCSPEAVIAAAFRFLLDREPKESILERFDVDVIGTYFPEFDRDLSSYLDPAR